MLDHYRARRVKDKKAHLGIMGSILYAFMGQLRARHVYLLITRPGGVGSKSEWAR
jgi:hypothetical protein